MSVFYKKELNLGKLWNIPRVVIDKINNHYQIYDFYNYRGYTHPANTHKKIFLEYLCFLKRAFNVYNFHIQIKKNFSANGEILKAEDLKVYVQEIKQCIEKYNKLILYMRI